MVDDEARDAEGTSVLRLSVPRVEPHRLVVGWELRPPSGLVEGSSFSLELPDDVDLAGLPDLLAWTIALACLHPLALLLAPCRVELPVRLPAGHARTWERIAEATRFTHDRTAAVHAAAAGRPWGPVPGPPIAIVEDGPAVDVAAPGRRARGDGPPPAITAFSGGKDSLLQLSLLRELGFAPTAVSVTSPLSDRHDQSSDRRRAVFDAVAGQLGVEHVEVRSELRAMVDNDFPARLGWHTSVTELLDTHLYASAALAVAWARGAELALVASEAEVSETTTLDGRTLQHPHAMYSVVGQGTLDALVRPLGLVHGSLLYPLPSGQVQLLLWSRYPEARELQYSCWRVPPGRAACSECTQCLRVATGALRVGGDPSSTGIDWRRLLAAQAGWRPVLEGGLGLPDDAVRRSLHAQVVRNLAAVPPEEFALRTGRRRRSAVVRSYAELRAAVLAGPDPGPEPGYRHGALDLVPAPARAGLEAILDEAFHRADPDTYRAGMARSRGLLAWVTEPLGGDGGESAR